MEAPAGSNSVTPFELAVLVLHYLDTNGHRKTAQSFRREAKSVLGSAAVSLPPGVKNLQELLNEYVTAAERDTRRQTLQASNPVAQSLFSLLDFHAGLPTPQTLPPAFYATAASPTTAGAVAGQAGLITQQQQQQQQLNQAIRGLAPLLVPVQAMDLSYPAQHAGVGPQQQQQQQIAVGQLPGAAGAGQHTPGRHAHRKGAPKRRRLEEFGGSGAGGAGGAFGLGTGGADVHGSGQHVLPLVSPPGPDGATTGGGGASEGLRPLDLLNMPLDEEGLMSLLCDDDLQVRFASGLAQHITTAINHQLPGADSTGLGGEEHLVVGSIEDVLAELPADPAMAELLQQFVRCDYGGASLASPPTSAQKQRRPGSEQREQIVQAAGQKQQQQQRGVEACSEPQRAQAQPREASLEPQLPHAPKQQQVGAGEASAGQNAGKIGEETDAVLRQHPQQLSQQGEEALPSQPLPQVPSHSQQGEEALPSQPLPQVPSHSQQQEWQQQGDQDSAGDVGKLPRQPSAGPVKAMPSLQQQQQRQQQEGEERPLKPQQAALQQGKAPSAAGVELGKSNRGKQQAQQATPMQVEALASAAGPSGAAAGASAHPPAVQQRSREPTGNGAGGSSAHRGMHHLSGQEALPQLGQEAGDLQAHRPEEGEPVPLAQPSREAGTSAASVPPSPLGPAVTQQALVQPGRGSCGPQHRQQLWSGTVRSSKVPGDPASQGRGSAQPGSAELQQHQAQQKRQQQAPPHPGQESLQGQQAEDRGNAAASAARAPLQPLAGNSSGAGQPEHATRLDFSGRVKAVLGGAVAMDDADLLLDELGFGEGEPAAAAREQEQPEGETQGEGVQHQRGIDFSSYVEGSLGGAVAMEAADALLDELDF